MIKAQSLRLLVKIYVYGINEKLAGWIENWSGNRKQNAVINRCGSDWRAVISGVSQECVLDPLLFILFINNVERVLETISTMVITLNCVIR